MIFRNPVERSRRLYCCFAGIRIDSRLRGIRRPNLAGKDADGGAGAEGFNMFARTLAAWCVVAVGAHCLALEVPTNYFIGAGNIPVGESIDVRGNARLTIDFSQESFESIADINLWDEATLIVRSGRVTGEIREIGRAHV